MDYLKDMDKFKKTNYKIQITKNRIEHHLEINKHLMGTILF